MTENNVIIWGAGRIGRGFAADLFDAGGYPITFVDQVPELIQQLQQAGQYTVVYATGAEDRKDHVISGYSALATSQSEALASAVAAADIMVLAVFPRDFAAVAEQLLPGIWLRSAQRPDVPLDIFLCTNLSHAAAKFREHLQEVLPPGLQMYAAENIGVVESLVMRIVAAAPKEERERDPLLVWTNGFSEFPVDRAAIKGGLPHVPGLRLVDDMAAEEMRKLYTYNTCHAALAYLGALSGHDLIVDCLANPGLRAEAEAILNETSRALQAEYGFSADDMDRWVQNVLTHTDNPALGDTVSRFGGDPRRKLRRSDRLIGPILLAQKRGIEPVHLIRAVAAGFLFQNPDDPGAVFVQERVQNLGLEGAVREVCELGPGDDDLVVAIVRAYHSLPLEAKWAKLAENAEKLGFEYEKTYHGCGQSVLAAVLETIGRFDETAFRAATPMAGGLGMVGDSTCSALTAANMAFGIVYPRRRDHFGADRDNKYRSYDMSRRLRQRFIEDYGSITCYDIHRNTMGQAFDLLDSDQLKAFEAAGAHDDKCTNVVGRASRWAVEIIGEEIIKDALRDS